MNPSRGALKFCLFAFVHLLVLSDVITLLTRNLYLPSIEASTQVKHRKIQLQSLQNRTQPFYVELKELCKSSTVTLNSKDMTNLHVRTVLEYL